MSFKTLLAYQKGFDLAMEIFQITKTFPKSEVFGLTSQIIRSSRAVCSAIAEGYRKRQLWLDFALACEYITLEKRLELQNKSQEIGKLLNYMMKNPSKFGL